MRYTAAELRLLSKIVAWEAGQRDIDRPRCVLPCPDFRPDLGRVPGQRDDDGIDCHDLAHRLRQHAEELERSGGIYR